MWRGSSFSSLYRPVQFARSGMPSESSREIFPAPAPVTDHKQSLKSQALVEPPKPIAQRMMNDGAISLEDAVYASRIIGKRVEEIAQIFGIDEDKADEIIRARAAKVRARTIADPDVMFALELDRLDEIMEGVYVKARSGAKENVDSYLKISASRRELLGMHQDAVRKRFLDGAEDGDLSDLTEEELAVLDRIQKRRAAAKAGGGSKPAPAPGRGSHAKK